MSSTKILLTLVLGALIFAGWSWNATAQEEPRGRGRFDPAEMQQRMMDSFKQSLKATDEEWKVLEPKVQAVMTASREASRGRGGFGGFGGGRGGRGGQGGQGGERGGRGDREATSDSPVSKAASELRTALEDEKTSKEDIQKKLATYRDTRAAARDALAKAQKELKELLTYRQEATLVLGGTLD
jgi:hypothetical protein